MAFEVCHVDAIGREYRDVGVQYTLLGSGAGKRRPEEDNRSICLWVQESPHSLTKGCRWCIGHSLRALGDKDHTLVLRA